MARNPYKAFADQSPKAAADRLFEVYAIGAKCARAHNIEGVRHALALLRGTLDERKSPEIALSLRAIYADIEAALERGEYKKVSSLFEELRALWQARIRLDQR